MTREAISLLRGLLVKNKDKRLGCVANIGEIAINKHPFFSPIDWDKLERRQVQPPVKPDIKSPTDVSNFDTDFTSENPKFTPTDQQLIQQIVQQDEFPNFSYVNPAFV